MTSKTLLVRIAFAIVTASLLLSEIALTRLFSGTIGYYFAFMSISVAMLGLGAGSLYVTLRGKVKPSAHSRAALASTGLALAGVASTLAYLRFYPSMGLQGMSGQLAYVLLFGALFFPFLFGGVLISIIFEAHRGEFGVMYAVDLAGAAVGCVVAVLLLDHVPAPSAMLLISALAGLGAPLFYLSTGEKRSAAVSGVVAVCCACTPLVLRGSALLSPNVIRNQVLPVLVTDKWNDFSRVIVKKGPFYTWGLSQRYPEVREPQFDLLIEGVAGTQIQDFHDRDFHRLDFLRYDIGSLPHLLRPTGSALTLGVGGGLDVLTARYFNKAPVVGVEVNPLVGSIVNNDFGDYSGRPYYLPEVQVFFENARTFVKRDKALYDVVTVTWVDSGAATGAGAFALTENYLYTVDAFRDYMARLKDDGVLTFMRSRYSPESDAIKGIGIAVEAMTAIGIQSPERNIIVTSVKSPHFGWRELTHVMLKKKPFTPEEIAIVDEARGRLWFADLYTPGRTNGDPPITNLITNRDREQVYASFNFDMAPTTDDRPFYFFLREWRGHPATRDVLTLRQSIITIFVLIAAFLVVPLIVVLKRGIRSPAGVVTPSIYFGLLGLGFMLVEMKLLQQSVLVVGNPTLSLAAVLSSLLLSTGAGALLSERIKKSNASRSRAGLVFGVLIVALLVAMVIAEPLANWLTGFPIAVRTAGLVLSIAPLGLLLGCPLPLGMSTLGEDEHAGGMVAWCWGINGLMGVAGSGVAIYLAIHWGLKMAFLAGVACYLVAASLYLLRLSRPRAA
ncbi:MAG: hypothetical protein HY898_11385 [Deltaproteobacteria bacterium]|nr:hypothetical protein [Deltaproteobacteria bacterium]